MTDPQTPATEAGRRMLAKNLGVGSYRAAILAKEDGR